MSDRIKGFVVTLERDMNDEDAERLRQAMLAIRGVASVDKSVDDINDLMARQRVRFEVQRDLFDVIRNVGNPKRE